MLKVLNAADKIVGVGPYIKKTPGHAPELSKLPSIGSDGRTPDFEVVLNVKPDIILPGMGGVWSEGHLEKIPDLTVVYLSLITWEDFVQNVRKIGYITDKEKEVEEFLKWREEGFNKIKGRTDGLSEDEKPRVLLLSHFRPGGPYTIWPEYNRFTTACEIAGGRPILPEVPFGVTIPPAGAVVDPEWVMEQNPDIIFVDVIRLKDCYSTDDPSEMATLREDLMNRPELAKVTAVKNGDVYLCHSLVARDATGGLVLAQYMAKCFQPVLFKDVDPRECHQEYLTRLQLEFNVYEHGVFVYPPFED
jgi:iron complex transport system substrate-binding protein